ncbi:sirohydrochlorin chelatase [Brevibacterium atlanticum]|uniref:sirohydrochlorin chelatase n=1 Tax=Brevibacterium atlanticum TaxID=2697563 RepID=UPI0014228E1A|nr:CbiX/SirB N-terminal domain-containing protein [Brevibacterium atlanticum]
MTGRSSRGLPSLGLISHGTSSAQGQALIEALAAEVARDLRGRGLVDEVMLGHVDVQEPTVAEVVDRLPHDRPVILVPLLLSPGYHVHVDLAEAVDHAQTIDPALKSDRADDANPAEVATRTADSTEAATRTAGTPARDIRLTKTLGPDPRLARILAERLPALRDDDEVVLAAAGSSDERANDSCREMGELLANELRRPVDVGFLAGAGTPLKSFVEQNEHAVKRLVLANYLLAPGFFDDLARGLIADTQNILSSPLLTTETSQGNAQKHPQSSHQPTDPTTSQSGQAADAGIPAESGFAVPALLVDIIYDRVVSAL